ncbi:MAG: helix-turn-helix transcriptional regulator [Bacteroidota bacterium]
MLDRLTQVIKLKELSSSQFADEIGVQRSSVSHVLSGRNKPSLDFITKVILRFPDINPEWLLTGRGKMLLEDMSVLPEAVVKDTQLDLIPKEEDPPEYLSSKSDDEKSVQGSKKEKTGRTKHPTGSSTIEKIVIFYKDGSFSEYLPNE